MESLDWADDLGSGALEGQPWVTPRGAGRRILVEALTRILDEAAAIEAAGAFIVIARGPALERYFGPFSKREDAVAAAQTEHRAWQHEFPRMQIEFDVAPLADGTELDSHGEP